MVPICLLRRFDSDEKVERCGVARRARAVAPRVGRSKSDDDLKKEVDQLRRDLGQVLINQKALEAENSALRNRVDAREQAGDTLEAEINALAESMDYAAATTVKSEANPITIFGEMRHRTGWTFDRDFGADGTAGDDEGSFTQGRYRVGFDFEFDRDVSARFSVQSAGNFGTSDLGTVRLYEAWIHARNLFGKKELSARVGRQEVVLGNEFQFGNSDFFDGFTHDGTHMMWESDNFNLHFIYTRESSDGPSNSTNFAFSPAGSGATFGHDDDELYSLYFTLKTIENHELDLYWIYLNGHNGSAFGSLGNGLGAPASGSNSKFGSTDEAYYHTVGGRIGGVFPTVASGLDWNVEVAYQFGSLDDASDTDVDGLAIEAEFGITFNADNNFPHLRSRPCTPRVRTAMTAATSRCSRSATLTRLLITPAVVLATAS